MNFNRAGAYYLAGSLGGAVTVLLNWLLAEAFSSFSFMAQPHLTDFYAPMALGGVAALLYFLPITLTWIWRGVILSIFAALIYMGHDDGWLYGGAIHPGEFLEKDALIQFAVYVVGWGVVSSFLLRNE